MTQHARPRAVDLPFDLVACELSRIVDEQPDDLRVVVAFVPELERELVIRLDLFGHRADVAKFHAELVVGRAGLRVVLAPSVGAKGLQLRENFLDRHGDDNTPNEKHAKHGRCAGNSVTSEPASDGNEFGHQPDNI